MKLGAMSNPFSKMLLDLREVMGIKQADLADKFNISPQHLCDLEKGKRGPSVKLVNRICTCLGRGGLGKKAWHQAAAKAHGWEI